MHIAKENGAIIRLQVASDVVPCVGFLSLHALILCNCAALAYHEHALRLSTCALCISARGGTHLVVMHANTKVSRVNRRVQVEINSVPGVVN